MVAISAKLFFVKNMQEIPNTDFLQGETIAPGLYVVATPIGNARDISLRALDVLAGVDVVLCEDTRITKKLFALHGLSNKMQAYHEHNGDKMRPKILGWLAEGQSVALVSDAGTPLISDPGYPLIVAAREAGAKIVSVPGPSSPMAALSIAGLPTDKFMFLGFLPSKKNARQKALQDVVSLSATLVLFESAKRLTALLGDIDYILGARQVVVCRELTKKFEEVVAGTAAGLKAQYEASGPPKGEIVVLIKGAEALEKWSKAEVETALHTQLPEKGTRRAADEIAILSGWPRREVYQLALAQQNASPPSSSDEAPL
ncbi:MAG: 16S rRNA (cytidine(1402)-2'-O)-methyltransferase [Parvibaculales bacterium]